ncbi:MAG: septum formation protein Maf [Epsilonproteobacteria bacterium]|nr:MAG: septum formation protein Maf [Campylobacterota bacterium]RLA65667.1 MAG: septum formation protein Maf [Campylobacterota bacterium]
MNQKKYTLILASQSPRRIELLGHLNIPFEIIPSNIVEDPQETALKLAELKGINICESLKGREGYGETFFPFVVSSDTQVRLGEKIFGKPANREEAKKILLELQGKSHEVITAVYMGRFDISTGEFLHSAFYCTSKVTFDQISDDILDQYLDTGDSLDKAGAYGIQGPGLIFINHIEGSYSNVVGFPLAEFLKQLKEFLGDSTNWRSLFHE